MAFYNEQEDEELGQPQQIGAQSATIGGGQQTKAGNPGNPSAQAPDKPGNFVGIKTYLDANKNQAGKLGDQTANVVNQSAQEARQGLGDIQNKFNQQAVGVEADQGAIEQFNQGAETLSDQQKGIVKNQLNAQYQGPQDLTSLNDDYNKVNSQISKAFGNIQGTGTEEGRVGLIEQVNAKPRTAGMNTFDSALLSSGGGREKLAQAAQANKDVNAEALGSANLTAQQKAAQAKAVTDQTRQNTESALQAQQSQLGQSLQQRLKDMQAGVVNNNNAFVQDIGDSNNELNQATLDALGLNTENLMYDVGDVDFNKYLKQASPGDINQSNVATQQDFLRSQALADIAGGQGLLNQDDIGKAGTAMGTSFDQEGLKSAMSAAKQKNVGLALGKPQSLHALAKTGLSSGLQQNLQQSVNPVLSTLIDKLDGSSDYKTELNKYADALEKVYKDDYTKYYNSKGGAGSVLDSWDDAQMPKNGEGVHGHAAKMKSYISSLREAKDKNSLLKLLGASGQQVAVNDNQKRGS